MKTRLLLGAVAVLTTACAAPLRGTSDEARAAPRQELRRDEQAGTDAPRSSPPAAQEEFSFRGKRFGAPPFPWMRELPSAATLRDAGLKSFEDPGDGPSFGDIDMDSVVYSYWGNRLYEIEVRKRGLPNEAEALRLADSLQRAIDVKFKTNSESWEHTQSRGEEKPWDSPYKKEILVKTYGGKRVALSGDTLLQIDVQGKSYREKGRFDVTVRLLDRGAYREILGRLRAKS